MFWLLTDKLNPENDEKIFRAILYLFKSQLVPDFLC
jgi:hypothetical protein